ncbi:DUF6783 domain-containing protein [Blautia wexlerae]
MQIAGMIFQTRSSVLTGSYGRP